MAEWYENLTRRQRDHIPALTTARYPLTGTGVQLTDEAGTALTLTQITTVTLTIYNLEVTPPVAITGTWPRDIKNASGSGGSVSAAGLLVLVVPRADNALITAASAHERRRWVITYTYSTGTKTRELVVDRLIVQPL